MFGKKKADPQAAAPESAAPVEAPVKAPKQKAPAGPKTPLTLGDIAVIGSCVCLVATLVFELLALKVLALF